MAARELSVPGAWLFTPTRHTDRRGLVFEWFTAAGFRDAAGHDLAVAQANCSVSRRGVLRGIHFAQLPPGQAKYVTCVSGAVLDVAVDLRVGSPTFGRWESVVLDEDNRASLYLAEGLGHAFYALADPSTVMYLCSAPYDPDREFTVSPTDPALGITWPDGEAPILSDRDAAAPTLAQLRHDGALPTWQASREFVEGLRRRASS